MYARGLAICAYSEKEQFIRKCRSIVTRRADHFRSASQALVTRKRVGAGLPINVARWDIVSTGQIRTVRADDEALR